MAKCSICSSPARRAIDAGLASGERPADLLRVFGDTYSSSAMYRHCRDHQSPSALAVSWLDGETTTGELLSDLAGLRRNLFAQYAEQRSKGEAAASTRSAHEAHAVSATLLKAHAMDDDSILSLRWAERTVRAIARATRNDPSHARALAAAARELNDSELADDAEALADSAEIYLSTTR
ncbi:MAG: hypothetical protein JWO18_2028 [Microbacteriaceae bacterium]|nr:hypothetical protein [Microbacteriaceae bacterium]